MAKRKLAKSKAQSKSKRVVNEINELNACIQKDQVKLIPAYEKAIARSQKSVLQLTAKLDKLTKKTNSINAKKEKGVSKTDRTAVLSLQKELGLLNAENVSLTAGYKKFTAQQKAIKVFEKEWRMNAAKNKLKSKDNKSGKLKKLLKEKFSHRFNNSR